MNKRLISIFWGLVLIVAGGWTLAENLGYVVQPAPLIWVAIFAALSILFFTSYFVNGIGQWGWLFPACITAAVAFTIYVGEHGTPGNAIPSLILGSVAIPFLAAFFLDRARNWWALIPAWAMVAIIGVINFADQGNDELFVFLILFSIALPFLIVYLVNRSQRWALIPFYVLLVVSLVPWIESQVAGEWIAGYILYAIAVPFLLIFLLDRSRKWALIPAFSLIVIGTIPILTTRAEGELIAAFINLAIALPFLVAYLWTPRAWWALIPAGIMGSIAVGVGLLGIFGENAITGGLIGGIIWIGWGATFGVLWLRRQTIPTTWAVYPALGLGLFGLCILLLGERMNDLWPLLFILAGAIIIYATWRGRNAG